MMPSLVQSGPSRSGAYIFKHGDRVTKVDATGERSKVARLRAQARWLQVVYPSFNIDIAPTGYTMPLLNAWLDEYRDDGAFRQIVAVAQARIWSQLVPRWDDVKDAIDAKIVKVITTMQSLPWLLEEYKRFEYSFTKARVDWDSLPQCLTHGDLTFENTMWHPVEGLVLIDPLPPLTTQMPPIRAIDYGKLLQSCIGWDGAPCDTGIVSALCENDNERVASKLMLLLALGRLAPYTALHERTHVLELFDRAHDL